MAAAEVQNSGATTAAASSLTPTFGGNTTPGNVCFCIISTIGADVSPSGVSGLGGNWDFPVRATDPSVANKFNYIYACTITTAATVVTINFTGSTAASATIIEVSGCSLEIDDYGPGFQNASATATLEEWTTQVNGDFIIAFDSWNSNTTVSTNPTGYTMCTAQISTGCGLSVGYQVQATAANIASTTWVTAASATNFAWAIAFKNSITAGGNVAALYQISAQATSGSVTSATVLLTPNQGDFLICKLGTQGAIGTFTPSDGVNSWVQDVQLTSSSASPGLYHAANVSPATPASPLSFTMTINAPESLNMIVEDWSNVAAKDSTGSSAATTSTTINSGSVVTVASNTLIVAVGVFASVSTVTAGPTGTYGSSGNHLNLTAFRTPTVSAYDVVASQGTYSTTWTCSSTTVSGVIASYTIVKYVPPVTLTIGVNYVEDWSLDY